MFLGLVARAGRSGAWLGRRPSPPAGFTLVELLVVITIIGILIGMMLPAVNMVREAGRQATCANNLRQLGLAMDLYNAKHGSLPLGAWYNGVTVGKDWRLTEYGWSALHLILPYIEQEAIYNLFDFTPKMGSDQSPGWKTVPGSIPAKNVRAHRIPVFICPSDSSPGLLPGSTVTLSNYVGSAGCTQASLTGNASSSPCTCSQPYNTYYPKPSPRVVGPFRVHNTTTLRPAITHAMIRDGASTTIMMGEMRYGCSPHIEGGWASSTNGCAIITTIIPINYDTCQGYDACANNGCGSKNNYNTSIGFKAAHPAGANFLMCDGSVHFIAESIDHQLYQYLGACDDGHAARIP